MLTGTERSAFSICRAMPEVRSVGAARGRSAPARRRLRHQHPRSVEASERVRAASIGMPLAPRSRGRGAPTRTRLRYSGRRPRPARYRTARRLPAATSTSASGTMSHLEHRRTRRPTDRADRLGLRGSCRCARRAGAGVLVERRSSTQTMSRNSKGFRLCMMSAGRSARSSTGMASPPSIAPGS